MTVAAPSANGVSTTSRPLAPRPAQRPTSALELIRSSDRSEAIPPSAPEPASAAVSVQPPGFSPEQLAALSAPLDRAKVRQREQGRSRVSYLEGWQVIAEANRIFGFDGWQRQTTSIHCVSQAERSIGAGHRPGWGVTYIARVRVTVAVHGGAPLIREGSGAGHGIDVDLGQAHESALKEAETDAMKRALMTFGNPFGLALYDKQQREVSGPDARPLQSAAATSRPAPSAQPPLRSTAALPPAAASADPGLAELDPTTIRQLHTTLRSLPAPLLAGFTKAFRKRFQVPEDAPSIADRICQRQHHDWIEAFLVQHQAPASNQPGTQQA
jgi:DNA recombination protein Rad52